MPPDKKRRMIDWWLHAQYAINRTSHGELDDWVDNDDPAEDSKRDKMEVIKSLFRHGFL